MKTTFEERKERAIELLEQLDIYKPYINGFKTKKTKTCWFENFGGFWTEQDQELLDKQHEFEDKYNATVYAITHEYTGFGECYDFLFVSGYKEDLGHEIEKLGPGQFSVYAYVWNKDDEDCSEFGSIGIQSFGGGIRRIY